MTALAPELASVAEELADAEVRPARGRLDASLLPRRPRRRPRPRRRDRRRPGADFRDQAPLPRLRLRRALGAAAEARSELRPADAGADPAAEAERRLVEAEERAGALAAELSHARAEAAPRFAEEVSAALAGLAMGEGDFRRRAARAGRDRPRRRLLPRPPESRPSVRARRRDRLRRRALADRARPPHRGARGGGRAHDRLRRDRRRDRRPDGARGRRGAPGPRRSRAGRHHHAPASDCERCRRALPRREGAGRPDPHPDRATLDAERKEELERMLGGAEFLSPPMSFVEFRGNAKLDRRTKRLVKRLGPDDIAIVDHADLDRISAEELLESGVRVVFNVSDSVTGRFPNPGPLRPRPRRRPAHRRHRHGALRRGEGGRAACRPRLRPLPQRHPIAAGRSRGRARPRGGLTVQRGRVAEALEDFADNTMRFLRGEEAPHRGRRAAAAPDAVPRQACGRRAARAPEAVDDLRIVRTYIRDFKPVPRRRRRRRGPADRGRLQAGRRRR